MKIKATIIDKVGLMRTITRLAHEILEKNRGAKNLVLIGIRTRGEFLARRLREKIAEIENIELPLGVLDATLYRDDFRTRLKQPEISVTDIIGVTDYVNFQVRILQQCASCIEKNRIRFCGEFSAIEFKINA